MGSINKSQAVRVVVEPWLGRHHVYGIFLLPNSYYPEQLLVLGFKGLGCVCLNSQPDLNDLCMLFIPEGYYPIKVYLKTRYAICMVFLGWGRKLKDCENWIVSYCHKADKQLP